MTPEALLATTVGVWDEISNVNVGTTALMDMVYTDVSPDPGAKDFQINIPMSVPVANQTTQTAGMDYVAPVYNGYAINYLPIRLTQQLTHNVRIPNIDKVFTNVEIANTLVQPALVAMAEQANGYLATFLSPTIYNVNPVIATTGGTVTPKQFLQGQLNLIRQKVPGVKNPSIMSFVQHPVVHTNQLSDDLWTKACQAGNRFAEQARVDAMIDVAYGAKQVYDQQMPQSGTDPNQTYISAYMSKYALAVAYRTVPKPDEKVVYYKYLPWKGLSILVEIGYDKITKCWYMSFDAYMGATPARKEQMQLFSTAQ